MSQPPLEPLTQLRESFRAAAARQIAAERRRRHRRAALIAAAALTTTGGVAAATHFISVGSPHREPAIKERPFSPSGPGTIAVTAADPDSPLPWGVLVYRTPAGESCALAGAVRGSELGLVTGGRFHPFQRRSGGACGDLARSPFFGDIRIAGDRTLVYGRSRDDVATMRVSVPGERPRSATPGAGGAFLFVFDRGAESGGLRLSARDASGRRIR